MLSLDLSLNLTITLNNSLLSLYEHLNASDGVALLSFDEVYQWGDDVIKILSHRGLLKPVSKASSIECVGCEYRCFQEVIVTSGDSDRAFIVCDVPEMQFQMGRVPVSLDRLKRWRISCTQVANILQTLLGLDNAIEEKSDMIRLGMLQGECGRRWVVLNKKPLSIEINQTQIPINEVLYADALTLCIDEVRIKELVNSKELKTKKAYTPSTEKAESSKQATQVMYQHWKDAYIQLKAKHSDKSKVWCSQQIAKMDIACGRDAQTIYKNME